MDRYLGLRVTFNQIRVPKCADTNTPSVVYHISGGIQGQVGWGQLGLVGDNPWQAGWN